MSTASCRPRRRKAAELFERHSSPSSGTTTSPRPPSDPAAARSPRAAAADTEVQGSRIAPRRAAEAPARRPVGAKDSPCARRPRSSQPRHRTGLEEAVSIPRTRASNCGRSRAPKAPARTFERQEHAASRAPELRAAAKASARSSCSGENSPRNSAARASETAGRAWRAPGRRQPEGTSRRGTGGEARALRILRRGDPARG